jgi:D-sedoheptulose 7-phosphate isomerase
MNYMNTVKELNQILEEFFSARAQAFEQAVEALVRSLKSGRKLLVFGNGGSAAEADTSILTSVGNDSSFDDVFSRQIEALGESGDVALALTTSGKSPNVVKALQAARQKNMTTIALTGKSGCDIVPLCDYLLEVPSASTPRIQEAHLLLLHLLALELEKRLAGRSF